MPTGEDVAVFWLSAWGKPYQMQVSGTEQGERPAMGLLVHQTNYKCLANGCFEEG